MSPDSIWLEGVSVRVHLGVPDSERARRQKITVDLGLELDLAPCAAKDDFRLTADYFRLEKLVRAEAEARPRRLVETLAADIARLVLRSVRKVSRVHVAVHKRPAVMPKTREVVVRISRARS